jgi:hypothetical protein
LQQQGEHQSSSEHVTASAATLCEAYSRIRQVDRHNTKMIAFLSSTLDEIAKYTLLMQQIN